MKIGLMSDLHGYLPKFTEDVDVVCIAGDIFPLNIQSRYTESIVWFTKYFVPWATKLHCDKVIIIAGNHDFAFQTLGNIGSYEYYNGEYISLSIEDKLDLPEKIVYLQDRMYVYKGVRFYGTPWIPDLKNWAFYKNHDDLVDVFKNIPSDCDVLISHTAGTENDMGTSLQIPSLPMYGCKEINDKVINTSIKLWVCGHIHTGNHKVSTLSNGITKIVNVSLKDEDYRVNFEPLVIDIE